MQAISGAVADLSQTTGFAGNMTMFNEAKALPNLDGIFKRVRAKHLDINGLRLKWLP